MREAPHAPSKIPSWTTYFIRVHRFGKFNMGILGGFGSDLQ